MTHNDMGSPAIDRKVVDRLAEHMRVARAKNRWSQAEFAAKVDLSTGYVSEIERGIADPQLSTVERIADAIGLTVRLTEDAA